MMFKLRPMLLASLSGALYALSFPGYDYWTLAFFAFTPLFLAIDWHATKPWHAFALGWLTGFIAQSTEHYWLVGMLGNFSGFSKPVCLLFACIFYAFQAAQCGLFALFFMWLIRKKMNSMLAAASAWIVLEWFYPILFENYFANTLHNVPSLIQIVDLGGPTLLSGLELACSAAFFEAIKNFRSSKRQAYKPLVIVTACLLFTFAYSQWRIHDVARNSKNAPHIKVGLVQANMGMFAKHDDPYEGLRRHIVHSVALEKSEHPDLIVWPESAFNFLIPDNVKTLRGTALGPIRTPVLFGGLARRPAKDKDGNDEEQHFNTAFMTDRDGVIRGTYDKTYLLAFGEYLPLGSIFPSIYKLSPRTGHFTPGTHQNSLPLRINDVTYRIGTLICYEDILPVFVRTLMRTSHPHLLVNITNDAWFGDTIEPWTHLALAKFRAAEHHRFLVRATNSGVSAVIDPTGKMLSHTGVMTEETLTATVSLMSGTSLYEVLGNWPVLIALGLIGLFIYLRREATATE